MLYKTSHPRIVLGATTTIYKAMPHEDPMDMRDQFDVMGEINWCVIGSSTFRIDGEAMQTKEFFRRQGILGRCVVCWRSLLPASCERLCSKRTFTGPDGRPYRWDMLLRVAVVSIECIRARSHTQPVVLSAVSGRRIQGGGRKISQGYAWCHWSQEETPPRHRA